MIFQHIIIKIKNRDIWFDVFVDNNGTIQLIVVTGLNIRLESFVDTFELGRYIWYV